MKVGEGNRLNIVDVNALGCQLVEKPPGQGRAISGVDQYSSAGGADGEATGIGVKVTIISQILAMGVLGFGGNGGEKISGWEIQVGVRQRDYLHIADPDNVLGHDNPPLMPR